MHLNKRQVAAELLFELFVARVCLVQGLLEYARMLVRAQLAQQFLTASLRLLDCSLLSLVHVDYGRDFLDWLRLALLGDSRRVSHGAAVVTQQIVTFGATVIVTTSMKHVVVDDRFVAHTFSGRR